MWKNILRGIGILLLAATILGISVYQVRYKPMLTLFDVDKKAENFRQMDKIFPSHEIEASAEPIILPRSDRPFSFYFHGPDERPVSLEDSLASFSTTGFLIIRNDTILYENYFQGGNDRSTFTSFSLSKSITSMLVGIALGEGKIGSIDDPVDQYLPHLASSGYGGVSIRHVLQMASGIRFSEVYDDPDSDINQLMYSAFAWFEPLSEWIAQFGPDIEPGTRFHYQSINTAVLGMIMSEVYGQSLSEVIEEKIWKPMGAEGRASWITDEYETEIAFGFFNAMLRDYAKIGLVMLHDGFWNQRQIVPAAWVEACTTIDSTEARPAKEEGHSYQYHWWVPEGDEGEFHASGYMGQVIYVNPTQNIVIVKTGLEESKHLPMIREIARMISPMPEIEPPRVIQEISVKRIR